MRWTCFVKTDRAAAPRGRMGTARRPLTIHREEVNAFWRLTCSVDSPILSSAGARLSKVGRQGAWFHGQSKGGGTGRYPEVVRLTRSYKSERRAQRRGPAVHVAERPHVQLPYRDGDLGAAVAGRGTGCVSQEIQNDA